MKHQVTITLNPKYHWGCIIFGIEVPTKKQQFKKIEELEAEFQTSEDDGTLIHSEKKKLYYTTSEPKNIQFENYIKTEFQKDFNQELFDGMLELVICVTDSKSRIASIDNDNLAKSVMDALKGVVYHDDSQIYVLTVFKDCIKEYPAKSLMVAIRKIKNTGDDTAYPIKLFSMDDKIISNEIEPPVEITN